MHKGKIAALAVFLWAGAAVAQNQALGNVQQAADTMVRLCIAGGHTEASTVAGTGGANVSLRSLDVKGNVTGQFDISKSAAEGLVSGIDNAMTEVAANQADKVRECLKPLRDRLLDVLLPITPTGDKAPADRPQPKSDTALLFECHLGAMATSSDRVWMLNLFPTPIENGGSGLHEIFSLKNKGELLWPNDANGFPLMAYKCQLTNYDNSVIFNIELSFRLLFQQEVKRSDGGAQSGETYLARDWPISITKIDPGSANPFVFYIVNMNQYFVTVSPPDIATGKQLGDTTPKTITIIKPTGFQMHFSPSHPTPNEP